MALCVQSTDLGVTRETSIKWGKIWAFTKYFFFLLQPPPVSCLCLNTALIDGLLSVDLLGYTLNIIPCLVKTIFRIWQFLIFQITWSWRKVLLKFLKCCHCEGSLFPENRDSLHKITAIWPNLSKNIAVCIQNVFVGLYLYKCLCVCVLAVM